MEYYAKSENLQGHQETVKEHLRKVSALAREYGEALGLADAAGLEGLVHDWGSYYNSQYCTKIIAFFLRSRLLWPLSRVFRSACYFLAHIFSARPQKNAVYLLYFQKLSFHSFSRFSCSER